MTRLLENNENSKHEKRSARSNQRKQQQQLKKEILQVSMTPRNPTIKKSPLNRNIVAQKSEGKFQELRSSRNELPTHKQSKSLVNRQYVD